MVEREQKISIYKAKISGQSKSKYRKIIIAKRKYWNYWWIWNKDDSIQSNRWCYWYYLWESRESVTITKSTTNRIELVRKPINIWTILEIRQRRKRNLTLFRYYLIVNKSYKIDHLYCFQFLICFIRFYHWIFNNKGKSWLKKSKNDKK